MHAERQDLPDMLYHCSTTKATVELFINREILEDTVEISLASTHELMSAGRGSPATLAHSETVILAARSLAAICVLTGFLYFFFALAFLLSTGVNKTVSMTQSFSNDFFGVLQSTSRQKEKSLALSLVPNSERIESTERQTMELDAGEDAGSWRERVAVTQYVINVDGRSYRVAIKNSLKTETASYEDEAVLDEFEEKDMHMLSMPAQIEVRHPGTNKVLYGKNPREILLQLND